jgi:AmiR/NasT family two-component response regulator
MDVHTINMAPGPQSVPSVDEPLRTIVLYSPDLDFCVSLTMLFQDRYRIVTTTDLDMMVTFVNTYQPSVVLADTSPTPRTLNRFLGMKQRDPQVHIALLTVPQSHDSRLRIEIKNTVDAVFHKPIDITELCDFIAHAIHPVN